MIEHRTHSQAFDRGIPVPPRMPFETIDPARRQWRAIYALARPEELRAEEKRLSRLLAGARSSDAATALAHLRMALVRERLSARY